MLAGSSVSNPRTRRSNTGVKLGESGNSDKRQAREADRRARHKRRRIYVPVYLATETASASSRNVWMPRKAFAMIFSTPFPITAGAGGTSSTPARSSDGSLRIVRTTSIRSNSSRSPGGPAFGGAFAQ